MQNSNTFNDFIHSAFYSLMLPLPSLYEVTSRILHLMNLGWTGQKQSFIFVLWKRCSENVQQIYRRTPMPKCDLNKVETLLKSHFDMGVLL